MKKIISILLIILILLPFFNIKTYSLDETWYFIITAYYSPLPNQEAYLTGDYNSEKKLNWEWVKWASWKAVFSWMLAAPKTYTFWTKINLEWLWVGEVSDRWWAIVSAWNRGYENDRIDVWMWYWDEWLRRALYWWKRKVKWNVVDSNQKVTLDYNKILAPKWATKWLIKIPSVFNTWLWKWWDIDLIKKLQRLFTEVWLYRWEINGIYNNEVIDIVYNFQLENWIVSYPDSYWAWYWWKNTRELFLKDYLNWDFNKKEEIKVNSKTQKIEIKEQIIKEEPLKIEETKNIIKEQEKVNLDNNNVKENNIEQEKVDNNISNDVISNNDKNLEIFDKTISWNEDIKKIQSILKELSLYNWNLTWNYKDIQSTIYDYQISKDIVSWKKSIWAWVLWPKTRASLKQTYIEYLWKLEEKRLEQIRIEEEKKKIEEEKRLEEIRIQEEKKIEEQRKKELEEKYKYLEEISMKKAEEKVKNIWNPKFWEVSSSVRNLQNVLKELGYFNYKDTAIYWNITKQSILAYQIDKKLVSKDTDIWAWMIWPVTLNSIKNDLKEKILKEQLVNNEKNSWIISL